MFRSSLRPLSRLPVSPLSFSPAASFSSSNSKSTTASHYDVAVAMGDGIGPEIMRSCMKIFESAKVPLRFHEVEMGKSIYLAGHGTGMTVKARETVEKCGLLFKSPMETPKGEGVKSINVTARKVWNTFVNKRVFRSLEGVDTIHSRAGVPVDITLFRENIEDTYGGIEHFQTNDMAQCRRLISRPGSLQIHRHAFHTANQRGAKRVTCVHKANIMKLTDGLFLETFYQVAKDYPHIKADDVIVDDLCMKLVSQPHKFDFLVSPNLQGDIVSDLCAGLIGGLGVCPSANIGENISIFEAVHGTAPDIVGKNVANPMALLLSGLMMLRHLGLSAHAQEIQSALDRTLSNGYRTPDLMNEFVTKQATKPLKQVGTNEFTQTIINSMDLSKLPQQSQYIFPISPPVKPLKQIMSITPNRDMSKEKVNGIDLFLDCPLTPPELAEKLQKVIPSTGLPNLKLIMLSNRGTQVWPTGSFYTECVNHWRARFELPKGETQALSESAVLMFASQIAQHVRVCSTETLLEIDGKKRYTLAQGQ